MSEGMAHDNEDIARMVRNWTWTQYVQLPTECNANLQIAIIQALEKIEVEEESYKLPNSSKAFRIHRAIVEALEETQRC
jgi:hypothetical protein